MLRLDATTRKLQLILAGAVTTNELPVMVSYSDKAATTYTGATQMAESTGGTAVDICDAPAASTVRDIDYVNVRNADTVAATVTIQYDDNGTTYQIISAALAAGDQLVYTHGSGWQVIDADGQLKTVSTGGLSLTASNITNVPAGDVAATDVQAAIDELDTEKAPLASPTFTGTVTTSGSLIAGDPGAEASGITINGVTYESTFKVSDIDGTNYAQTILHRHSTVLEPIIVGARSNGNTSTHVAVTSGQGLFGIYAVGHNGTDYGIAGTSTFSVGTGTVSATSMPGKWTLSLSPNGTEVPTACITVDSDKTALFGGVVLLQAGSASAPALITTGDTNTGMWFPAADTIAFSTGGTERLRVDSSGNVGIGAAAAAHRLLVSGAVDTPLRVVTTGGTAAYIELANTTGSAFIGASGDSFGFYTSGSADLRLTVANTGLITVASGGVLALQAGSASAPALITTGDTNTGMWFPAADTIAFSTGGTERLRVDSSGNVGLGTVGYTLGSSLQLGRVTSFAHDINSGYYGSGWLGASPTYAVTGNYAVRVHTDSATGVINLQTASAGTAGNAVTFTTRLQIADAAGVVTVAATTASTSLTTGALVVSGGLGVAKEISAASLRLDYTNTGTVGAVTINKASGRVNIAAAGTSVVVTNSLVTAASHVFAVVSTNDTTARVTAVVPAAGSFTIYTVATTAQTSFDFVVINAD